MALDQRQLDQRVPLVLHLPSLILPYRRSDSCPAQKNKKIIKKTAKKCRRTRRQPNRGSVNRLLRPWHIGTIASVRSGPLTPVPFNPTTMETPSRAGKKRALSQVRKTPGGGGGGGGSRGSGISGISAGGRAIAYGDHVRLAVKATGLLGAEGVLDSECRLIQGSTTRQDRCVWRICTAFQYSAAKELNEYIKETAHAPEDDVGEEISGRTNDSVDSQLHALQRGKRYEDMQNAATNQQRRGEPVKFGDTIQLLHVNSGKFLTVRSNKTAELERENLQICLDSSGSTMSHLKVEARLKIDEEAVMLQNNTEIFFKVAEREREFVHCSKDGFKIHSIAFGGAAPVGQKCYVEEGETFEINCSLTKTVWRVQVYDAVDNAFGSEYLRAGDVVSLLPQPPYLIPISS